MRQRQRSYVCPLSSATRPSQNFLRAERALRQRTSKFPLRRPLNPEVSSLRGFPLCKRLHYGATLSLYGKRNSCFPFLIRKAQSQEANPPQARSLPSHAACRVPSKRCLRCKDLLRLTDRTDCAGNPRADTPRHSLLRRDT